MMEKFRDDPRITVRKSGPPDPEGKCVVYWMQRAQHAFDNPALDVAVDAGNELGMPVVVFFAPVPFYPRANLRHFSFLADGIAEMAKGMARRRIGFVLRPYPAHSLLKFCDQVRAAAAPGFGQPPDSAIPPALAKDFHLQSPVARLKPEGSSDPEAIRQTKTANVS